MFPKAILVGAFAALAVAQSTVLTFTRVPNPVTAGTANAITYATNDTMSPVTITLRKGESGNLKTISNLTTDATGGQYVWTPDTSLENGADYALEIIQGTQMNYFGPFTLQGAGKTSSSSTTSSAHSSASASVTVMHNSTMTGMTISMGTGTSMSRNMTMSSLTLSSTSSMTPTAAGTSGAGFQGTTAATPSSTTGAAVANVATGSSAVALIFGAIAAIFFC